MFLLFNQDIPKDKQKELISQPFIQTIFGKYFKSLNITSIKPETLVKDDSFITGDWIRINETDYWLRLSNEMEITLSGKYDRFIIRTPRERFRIDIDDKSERDVFNVLLDYPYDYIQKLLNILNDYPNEKERVLFTKKYEFNQYVLFHHKIYKILFFFIYNSSISNPPNPAVHEDKFFQEKYRVYIYNKNNYNVSMGKKKKRKSIKKYKKYNK